MKKALLYVSTILVFFVLFIYHGISYAAPSLSISPDIKGSVGNKLVIKIEDFCIYNAGTLVNIMWDGAPIGSGISPDFELDFIVPKDSEMGEHTILAIADCSGQPPDIKATTEQVEITYIVIDQDNISEEKGDSPTTRSEDNELDLTNEESRSSDQKNDDIDWFNNWLYIGLLAFGVILIIVAIIMVLVKSKTNKIDLNNKQTSKSEKQVNNNTTKQIIQDKKEPEKPTKKSSFFKKFKKTEEVKKPIKSRVEFEE